MLKGKKFLEKNLEGKIELSFTSVDMKKGVPYYIVITNNNEEYQAHFAKMSNFQVDSIITNSKKSVNLSCEDLELKSKEMLFDKILLLSALEEKKELLLV